MTSFAQALDLYDRGQVKESLPLFQQALQERPGDVEVMYKAMLTLVTMRRYAECASWLQQLVPHINPVETPAWMMAGFYYNLAISYEASGQWGLAARNHRNALTFDSAAVLPKINLGSHAYRVGKLSEGRAWHDKALEPETVDVESRPGRSFLRLLRGDYLGGFAEYEARWKLPQTLAQAHIPRDAFRWKGKPLNGRRILVVGEQGVGDVLMMARYLPMVEAKGGKVTLVTYAGLIPLLQQSFPSVEVRAFEEKYRSAHWWVPMMSLPHVFGTTLDTIPEAKCLVAEPMLPPGNQLRVGWVSRGNVLHMNDCDRSCRGDEFASLLSTPDVEFIHLDENELRLSHHIQDFLGTARLIASLDLVISIDSAVAHCAGALGVPCWLIPPSAPEWRWGEPKAPIERGTPWYPTHTIYRRRHVNDWAGVINRAIASLERLKSNPSIATELQQRRSA